MMVYVVEWTDCGESGILGVFDDRGEADAYKAEVQAHESARISVGEYDTKAPRRALPGAWVARMGRGASVPQSVGFSIFSQPDSVAERFSNGTLVAYGATEDEAISRVAAMSKEAPDVEG